VYSRLAAKHRLRAWVQLLAVAATYPDRRWRAVTIGREGGSKPAARVMALTAPSAGQAAGLLEQLVDLRERATRGPLPLPVKSAAAYAGERLGRVFPEVAMDAANKEWVGGERFPGEHAETAHTIAWGEGGRLEKIGGMPDEVERTWDWPAVGTPRREEPERSETRFGVLAMRVWAPLLMQEQKQ